ncbi:MAG: helix-turn-helix domain-containing protein [Bacilli bacterium]|nr:helix-turn-helix transcriptional regulator [Bacilli bacterium]
MDQERIGKFICELRKEKNMTQQELADKLNVTDRAVSHWENGRRLPDYSLLSELCEVLSVSINELFLGERISNEKYKEKAEENMSKLIKDNYSKELLLKRTLKGFITGIVVFIIVYIIMNR